MRGHEVCWGSDDLTLQRFLDRALPCASPLLWQVQDYTAPEAPGRGQDTRHPAKVGMEVGMGLPTKSVANVK